MTKNIYNSSGKIIGTIEHNKTNIIIKNYSKPILIIEDERLINSIEYRKLNEDIVVELFDKYFLTIGEIASIYDVNYSNVNKFISKCTKIKTPKKYGRRNSSYGKIFSEKRIENLKLGHKKFFENGGKIQPYVRTEEIKQKISNGVKKAQKEGRLPNPREVAKKAWADGKFKNVNFKRGIGGWFTSLKTNKRYFFRSLLELNYFIILENDTSVVTYDYEPFSIVCENGKRYTPDFLVNNSTVVELKSKNFIYKQGGSIQENFEYKMNQIQNYCILNNLEFKIVYDVDIGFESEKYKKFIRNSDVVKKYKIVFQEKERVWS